MRRVVLCACLASVTLRVSPALKAAGVRAAIMPDPNGFYFVVMQAPPPRPAQ